MGHIPTQSRRAFAQRDAIIPACAGLPEMMVGEILRSHQELAAGGVWVFAWICERTDCRVLVRRGLILRHSSSALGRGRERDKAQRVVC